MVVRRSSVPQEATKLVLRVLVLERSIPKVANLAETEIPIILVLKDSTKAAARALEQEIAILKPVNRAATAVLKESTGAQRRLKCQVLLVPDMVLRIRKRAKDATYLTALPAVILVRARSALLVSSFPRKALARFVVLVVLVTRVPSEATRSAPRALDLEARIARLVQFAQTEVRPMLVPSEITRLVPIAPVLAL